MHAKQQSQNFLLRGISRATMTVLGIVLVLTLILVFTEPAQAQTFQVIHTFSGADGAFPQTGLTIDSSGNLYGTTVAGGYTGGDCSNGGCGIVFKLVKGISGWVETTLYSFPGDYDGGNPLSRVIIAPDGTLFGTTSWGGGDCNVNETNCGTFFHLTPPPAERASALAPWSETVLYTYTSENGAYPAGDLIVDQAGNVYGTSQGGGPARMGVVYELTPSGGGWVGTVLYAFQGPPDGENPVGGVVFDQSGNLYGVTTYGGPDDAGTIYQLSQPGSTWTEQILHAFHNRDGSVPEGGLIIDSSGKLYGTTAAGGTVGEGTIFEFKPGSGGLTVNTLYSFSSGCTGTCGAQAKLMMDAAGNLYGTTTYGGAYGAGNVFKLAPSNGGWTYTSLHDFTGQNDSTGAYPMCSLVMGASGNLYGTTDEGGAHNNGVVFEITP